jgi:pimeloyl-ACP methyl ester carboxylesterase
MSSPRRSILVIHGALGSGAQMQPVADSLTSLGTPVLIELPGHGGTPLEPGAVSNIESYADALAKHVARIRTAAPDAPAPVAFGFSMGGYVALALEARAPGTFGAVLTLGTKFDWTPEIASREVVRLDPLIIEQKVPTFAAALEQRHHGAGGWHLNLRNTAAVVRALGDAPVLNAESLPRIRIPVCIAVGARDDTVTAEEAQRAADVIGDASVAMIDAPHPIERVPPAEIARLLRGLLVRIR